MSQDILREKLKALTRGQLLFDEPMSAHTSIGVGGKADCLVYPGSAVEVGVIVAYLKSTGIRFLPVGNCTNLIVRDGGYRGVIINLSNLRGLGLDENTEGQVTLTVEAGTALTDIVHVLVEESLTGMEFCAGIPGSIGGAIRMNAGAYGRSMQDVVTKISLVNGLGQLKDVARGDLQFEYRNLDLPEGAVIIKGEFSLYKGTRETIQKTISDIRKDRKRKHPLQYPNAGSIFKNPAGMPAGQIIDELGLKGRRIGGAEISELHGNFIVNTGGATASDILALMALIQERSLALKGITLIPEVKVVGEDNEAIL